MELLFVNDYDETLQDYERVFEDLAAHAIQKLHRDDRFSLEVNFVDEEKIHEINRQYRKIDRPTDVISFAFLDEVENEIKIQGDVMLMLGEIFISVDQAKQQAKEYQHSLHRELCFLFVHGLLHLLGYDHQDEEEEKEMFQIQEEILQEKGITR